MTKSVRKIQVARGTRTTSEKQDVRWCGYRLDIGPCISERISQWSGEGFQRRSTHEALGTVRTEHRVAEKWEQSGEVLLFTFLALVCMCAHDL